MSQFAFSFLVARRASLPFLRLGFFPRPRGEGMTIQFWRFQLFPLVFTLFLFSHSPVQPPPVPPPAFSWLRNIRRFRMSGRDAPPFSSFCAVYSIFAIASPVTPGRCANFPPHRFLFLSQYPPIFLLLKFPLPTFFCPAAPMSCFLQAISFLFLLLHLKLWALPFPVARVRSSLLGNL